MAEAKINITIGSMVFSGEGAPEWLERQLDKLLAVAPDLMKLKVPLLDESTDTPPAHTPKNTHTGTLATFLTSKNATTNQVKKFLATAEWLHLKGNKRLKPSEVAKALSESNQKRLGNPADALNKNVTKGHCEKEGGQFFVTHEGRAALG
jgi:hypothetical protein